MLARHEASLLLRLDRFPMMDVSTQLQTATRDAPGSLALPPLFEHDNLNGQISRPQANGTSSSFYDPFSSRFFGRIPHQLPSPSSLSGIETSQPERRSSLVATSIADLPAFQPPAMLGNPVRPSHAFSALDFGTNNNSSNNNNPSRNYSNNEFEKPQYSSSTSTSFTTRDYEIVEPADSIRPGSGRPQPRYNNNNTRRRPYNQDEFDGPSHLLPPPSPQSINQRATELPTLPITLVADEQDEILTQVNAILSQCAFHFLAKYQFPIPIEREKPQVHRPSDREWTEWAYLLKRLATKRRIPARVLYKSQIKHLVTTLENSLDIRYSPRDLLSVASSSSPPPLGNYSHPSAGGAVNGNVNGNSNGCSINGSSGSGRPLKDDRNILQLISAALQVAKILMDAVAMEQLDDLYTRSESVIRQRRAARTQRGSFY